MLYGYFYLQQYTGGVVSNIMVNRVDVVSPSLGVYKIQISSLFSIFERITGIFLLLISLICIVLYKLKRILLTNYIFYSIYFMIYKSQLNSFIIISIFLFILLNFGYHLSFGIRYYLWDNYGMGELMVKNLRKSVIIFLSICFFIVLFMLLILLI